MLHQLTYLISLKMLLLILLLNIYKTATLETYAKFGFQISSKEIECVIIILYRIIHI